MRTRVTNRSEFNPLLAAWLVVQQVWWLLALGGFAVLASALWWFLTGDTGLPSVAGGATLFIIVAIVLPFAIHEFGHGVAIKYVRGVEYIELSRTLFRTSVTVHGAISPNMAMLISLMGPLPCALIGAVLWSIGYPVVAVFYLGHLLFLIPPFGDGQQLLRGLLSRLSYGD